MASIPRHTDYAALPCLSKEEAADLAEICRDLAEMRHSMLSQDRGSASVWHQHQRLAPPRRSVAPSPPRARPACRSRSLPPRSPRRSPRRAPSPASLQRRSSTSTTTCGRPGDRRGGRREAPLRRRCRSRLGITSREHPTPRTPAAPNRLRRACSYCPLRVCTLCGFSSCVNLSRTNPKYVKASSNSL